MNDLFVCFFHEVVFPDQIESGSHGRPKPSSHHSELLVQAVTVETSAAATVAGELETVGAAVNVTTPADAMVVVAVVAEGSAGREGAGLESFMGMKMFAAECSLRYSPPFSS